MDSKRKENRRRKLALFLSLVLLLQPMSVSSYAAKESKANRRLANGDSGNTSTTIALPDSALPDSKGAASQQEPAKQEPGKPEPNKQGPSQPEPSKQDPSQQAPDKQEADKKGTTNKQAETLAKLLDSLRPDLFPQVGKADLRLDADTKAAAAYQLKSLAEEGTPLSTPAQAAQSQKGQQGFFGLQPGLCELSRTDLAPEEAIRVRIDEAGKVYRVKSIDPTKLAGDEEPVHVQLPATVSALPAVGTDAPATTTSSVGAGSSTSSPGSSTNSPASSTGSPASSASSAADSKAPADATPPEGSRPLLSSVPTEGPLPLMSSRILSLDATKKTYQLVTYLNNWHMFPYGKQNLGSQESLTYLLETEEPLTKEEFEASLKVYAARPDDKAMPKNLAPQLTTDMSPLAHAGADLRAAFSAVFHASPKASANSASKASAKADAPADPDQGHKESDSPSLLSADRYSLEKISTADKTFWALTLPAPGEDAYILSLDIPLAKGKATSLFILNKDGQPSYAGLRNQLKTDAAYEEEALEGTLQLPLTPDLKTDDASENNQPLKAAPPAANDALKAQMEATGARGPARIEVQKVDADNPQITLSGAKFKLQQVRTGDAETGATPKLNAYVQEDTSKSSSKMVFDGLPDGLFILTETEAPAGYSKTFVKKVYDVENGFIRRQNQYIKAAEEDLNTTELEQEATGAAPYKLKVTNIDMGTETVTFLLLVDGEGKSSLKIEDKNNTLADFANKKNAVEVFEGSLEQVQTAYKDSLYTSTGLQKVQSPTTRTKENSLELQNLKNNEGQAKLIRVTLAYDQLPVQMSTTRTSSAGESSLQTTANLFSSLAEEYVTSTEVIPNKKNEQGQTFDLKVLKTDKAGGEAAAKPLAHAEFLLDGSLTNGSYKNLLTTGEDGQVTFKGLSDGTYTLRENLAPAGYERDEKVVQFKVEKGQPTFLAWLDKDGKPIASTSKAESSEPAAEGSSSEPGKVDTESVDLTQGLTFVNEKTDTKDGATLVVKLVDEANPTKVLPYIDFELKGKADTPTATYSETYKTNALGQARFVKLTEGTYVLRQTKKSPGYQYDKEGIEIEVTKDGQGNFKIYQVVNGAEGSERQEILNALTVTNRYQPNRLTFTKVSEEYAKSTVGATEGEEATATPLQGVGFTLNKNIYDEKTKNLVRQDKVDEAISNKGGKVIFPSHGSGYNPLDQPGEYELWETNPVKGYPRPRYPMAKFEVTEEGEIINLKIADKKYLSAEEWIAQKDVMYNDPDDNNTIVNIKGTASFSIKKVDAKGNPIKGARFRLQDIPTAAGAIQDWVTETDKDGIATWDVLTIPQNYFLEEISAPEGYAKPDNKWIVWVRHRDDMTYDILEQAHGSAYMEKTYPADPSKESADLNGDDKVDDKDTELYEKTKGNADLLKIQERGYGMELYKVPTRATVNTDSTGRYEVVKTPNKEANKNGNPDLDAVSSASVIPAFLYQFFADSDELIITNPDGTRRRLTMAELVTRDSETGKKVLDRAVKALEPTANKADTPLTTLSNTKGAKVTFETFYKDNGESKPLDDPIFEVYRVETKENGSTEEKLMTRGGSPWRVMADEHGQAVFDNLTPGDYVFKEKEVPKDYKRIKPESTFNEWKVRIKEDGTIDRENFTSAEQAKDSTDSQQILFPVEYKKQTPPDKWVPGTVEVNKKGFDERGKETPLEGATFSLYYGEPGTVINSDLPPIQTLQTDKDGKATFTTLMPGDPGVPKVYTLKETVPPTGYTGGSNFWRVQVYGSGLTTVSSADDLVPGNKNLDGDLTVKDFKLTALDKENKPTADGVLWPNLTGSFRADLRVGFTNPITGQTTQVKPGDYFTVKLDDRLHVGGLNFPGGNIDIKTGDKGKEVVLANGIYDYYSKTVTFTFTDAIGIVDGDLTASFQLYPDRQNLQSSGTYDFSNVVAGTRTNQTVKVAYGYTDQNEFWYLSDLKDYNMANFVWQINKETGYVEYLAYYKPVRDNALPLNGRMEFFIFNDGGFSKEQFEEAEIEVYEAKDNSDFIESFGIDFTGKTPIASNKAGGTVRYNEYISAFKYSNCWRYTLDNSNQKLIFRVRVPFDTQSKDIITYGLLTRGHRYSSKNAEDLYNGWVEGYTVNSSIRHTPSNMNVDQKPLAGYQTIYNTQANNMEIRLGKLTEEAKEGEQDPSYIPIDEGKLVMGLEKYKDDDESTKPVTDKDGRYDYSELEVDLADQTRDNAYKHLSLDLGSQLDGKYILSEKEAPDGYGKTGDQYVIQISQERRSILLLEVRDRHGKSKMKFSSGFDPESGQLTEEDIRYGGTPLYIERGVYDKPEWIPLYLVNPRRIIPHTGGSGLLPYVLGGLGLAGLAIGGLRKEDGHKKPRRSEDE